jgi:hypothetical protein
MPSTGCKRSGRATRGSVQLIGQGQTGDKAGGKCQLHRDLEVKGLPKIERHHIIDVLSGAVQSLRLRPEMAIYSVAVSPERLKRLDLIVE